MPTTEAPIQDPADIVLVSDLSANHKLTVVTLGQLTKKGGFPAYDFDGPAGASNLGLQRGDKVRLLSGGANNDNRVLTINSVDADNVFLESTHNLLSGDGAVEFDFEFIRRKE
jgi:hypothetical protein